MYDKKFCAQLSVTLFATLVWGQIANAQNAATSSNLRFKNLEDYLASMCSRITRRRSTATAHAFPQSAEQQEIMKAHGPSEMRNSSAVTSGTHNVKQ